MKFGIEAKSIPAILFFLAAMGLLIASVHTTTLADKAADDARDGLIPMEKAPAALDFTLPIVSGEGNGSSVDLLAMAKKEPVVFSFWAGYCEYCPLEMSHLDAYSKRYRGKILFYTVNSHDTPDIIRQYMAMHGFSLPVLSDAQHTVAAKYGVDSLPTVIIVDKSGHVRYGQSGFDPQMDTVFPHMLDALLKDG